MPSHNDIQGVRADDIRVMSKAKFGVNIQTLGATYTMTHDMPPLQFLDPGGAGRTVLLPTEADSKGLFFIITNRADAAEDLTVKEDSGTTTIGTISQNECAILVCDGVTWTIGVGTTT